MNNKTKVDFKNILAGIGAVILVVVLSAFAVSSFRGNEDLDATVLKGSSVKAKAKVGDELILYLKKIETPFTGKKFNFTVFDKTNGVYLAPFSLIGDGQQIDYVMPSGIQYVITEQEDSGGNRYDTRILCGIFGAKNYKDIKGKSVTLYPTDQGSRNIPCVFENKCPKGVLCSLEEVKKLPKIFTP